MPVLEKLVCINYAIWKAQVLATLCDAQLAGFLDGTAIAPAEKITTKAGATEEVEVPNLAYGVWKAQEQQVLSYLLASVSHDVLVQVAALPTAADVWKHIQTSFASQSCLSVLCLSHQYSHGTGYYSKGFFYCY